MTSLAVYTFASLGLLTTVLSIYNSGKRYLTAKRQQDRLTISLLKQVLFFPDSEFPCENVLVDGSSGAGKCINPACRRLHGLDHEPKSSMIEFVKHIKSAREQLDLCIYMLTQPLLVDIILTLVRNTKVKIRIITDSTEYQAAGTQISRLQENGIIVKSNKSRTRALMHHKFVIVDNSLLLSGSFNWTNNAIINNYEAIMVTSDQSFVDPFIQEFDKMWSEFSEHPIHRHHF